MFAGVGKKGEDLGKLRKESTPKSSHSVQDVLCPGVSCYCQLILIVPARTLLRKIGNDSLTTYIIDYKNIAILARCGFSRYHTSARANTQFQYTLFYQVAASVKMLQSYISRIIHSAVFILLMEPIYLG